jgi:outer membrane protein
MSADDDYKQSKLNMLPTLNSSVSQRYNWGRTPNPQTNIYNTEQSQQFFVDLNSDITLFSGLQQINNVKQKQYEYLIKKYDSDKIRNDISLNIAAAYLSILFNIELVNNAQRQVDVTKEQVEKTRKQVEAGAVAKGNLYDIQAQGANEEANLVNAKNNLMLAYLDLKQLLDLKASADFDIEKPKLEISGTPTILPANMIYDKAVGIMPEIKSAEYSVLSAEKTLEQAKGAYSPRLYASGSYGTTFSDQIREINPDLTYGNTIPFGKQFTNNRNGALLFGLQIPIYNGFQVTTNVRKSKIYKEAVDLNLQLEKNKLRKNIESAYADALAAYQTYIARKKSVDSYKESFKYTQEKFNVGMVTATDYNIAKIQMNNAESDLASSKYDYIFKVKILDFYLGRSLTLSDIASAGENQQDK